MLKLLRGFDLIDMFMFGYWFRFTICK